MASMSPEIRVPLAREGAPSELPLFDDVPQIAEGLLPASGETLTLFSWAPGYVAPKVLAAFEGKFSCRVNQVLFRTMDAAIARLRAGQVEADVFFPTLKVLGSLASARLLQPLQHAYLPNLEHAVWPTLRSPFYDVGSRYTVPYFTWTTGMSWRKDLLGKDPRGMYNPYDLFWDASLRGKVHLLDSNQDVIGLALVRGGITDLNSDDPAVLVAAKDSLLDLVDAVAPTLDGIDYRDLFSGEVALHQSWSGNLSFAQHYAPKPSDIRELAYLWPPELGTGVPGMVGSDVSVVLAGAKQPLLAHEFLNFVLDPEMSYLNSVYNGYRAPNIGVTPERLIRDEAIPRNLLNIITTEEDFQRGLQELQLAPATDVAWDAAYDEIVNAADRAREVYEADGT